MQSEAQPEPKPAPKPRRARRKLDRVVVVLLLLGALLGPFVTDALHIADTPQPLEGQRAGVAAAVDRLDDGDYVMFAFEYAPASARELDALADAVLRDALSSGAVPLTLSTSPVGALHAEAVFAALADDEPLLEARDQDETALTWGEDYFLLGYLPGNAVGVRSLSTTNDDFFKPNTIYDYDLHGDETNLTITDIETDIALLVVIADGTDDVRTWAEQLEGTGVPKVALVTTAIEPLTTPYIHADGYAGYLAGMRDAYSYNDARNLSNRSPYAMPEDAPDVPNPELARWHSMALGALMAALLISAGLFINLVRGLLRRRQR